MRAAGLIPWIFVLLLAGCGTAPRQAQPAPSATPVPRIFPTLTPLPLPTAAPTLDNFFASDGGGEPRGPSYWMIWNTCAPDNQSETARLNGGRAMGWVLLDDLLADPGVQLGGFPIETCPQALAVLQARSLAGEERTGDPAFSLAKQLLTAHFNLEASAESCLGVVEAVLGAHQLLHELGYDGERSLLDPASPADQLAQAELYLFALQQYNLGELCK